MSDYKKFFLKTGIFILLNIIYWQGFLAPLRMANLGVLTNSNTDSHLFTIPKNKTYNFVLLGSSHVAAFSGGDTHAHIESMLGMNYFSFGKRGAGVLPEKVYLSYFFNQHNQTKNVVYFLDPFVMYAPQYNKQYSFDEESYHNTVLLDLIANHFDWDVSFGYIKSNFDPRRKPSPQFAYSCGTNALPFSDQNKIHTAIAELYSGGLNMSHFNESAVSLSDVIRTTQEHNAHMIIIIPPLLWGEQDPGKKALLELLSQYKKQSDIDVYDLSNSVTDPSMYSEINHLNCKGVQYTTEHFLKPILERQKFVLTASHD